MVSNDKKGKISVYSKRGTEITSGSFCAIFFSFPLSKQQNVMVVFLRPNQKRFYVSMFLHFDIFVFFCFVLFLRLSPRSAEKREGKKDLRVTECFYSTFLLYGSRVISKEENLAARIPTCNPVLQWVPTDYSRYSGCG